MTSSIEGGIRQLNYVYTLHITFTFMATIVKKGSNQKVQRMLKVPNLLLVYWLYALDKDYSIDSHILNPFYNHIHIVQGG